MYFLMHHKASTTRGEGGLVVNKFKAISSSQQFGLASDRSDDSDRIQSVYSSKLVQVNLLFHARMNSLLACA